MENTKYTEAAKATIEKMTGCSICVLLDYDWLSQEIDNATLSYISVLRSGAEG